MDSRDRLRDLIRRALPALELYLERKTYKQYRTRLWAAVVRLFDGGNDANFMATFARSVDQQLTEAWNRGADEVGVAPDEMTNEDVNILRSIIANELQFIQRIAGDIQTDKADGMTREQFNKRYGARVDLWATRYLETQNRAKMVFGSKVKFEWRLGIAENHCPECNDLSGIVAFGREWEASRIIPQNPKNVLLTCQGWNCTCSLTPTSKRRTARALDKLTQIAMRRAGG